MKKWEQQSEDQDDNTKNHIAFLKSMNLPIESLSSITKQDALLIIDMQYDFVEQYDKLAPHGGAFAVPGGQSIIPKIDRAIDYFRKQGATIIFSRDYHPDNHVSFVGSGGSFPPHCIQGSIGSDIVKPLSDKILDQDHIVYKGFAQCIDSFGALKYGPKYAKDKGISRTSPCTLNLTGGFELKCSSRSLNPNAPPDVMAWQGPVKTPSLKNILDKLKGNIYVCGLAFDFCVGDTAINGHRIYPKRDFYILTDLTRAAGADPGLANIMGSNPDTLANKLGEAFLNHDIQLSNFVSGQVGGFKKAMYPFKKYLPEFGEPKYYSEKGDDPFWITKKKKLKSKSKSKSINNPFYETFF